MSITTRSATPEDEATCIDLLSELEAATGSGDGPRREVSTAFRELLTRTRGEIHLAEEATSRGTTILGMATVSYNVALRYNGEYCQLEELIVTPAARGKRVGGLLLEAAINGARRRGCSEMGLYLLESTEHNRTFYEKYGFELIGSELRQKLVD